MTIKQQTKAIKDCLADLGYNSSRVKCVRVNSNDRTLKTFRVQYSFGKMSKSWLGDINILVDNDGIISISTNGDDWNRVILCEINALSKALREAK